MFCNNILIPESNLPDAFADFFMSKTTSIVNETLIENDVYNGQRKLHVDNDDFMLPQDIINAVKSIKIKNCEGYDRIPQRVLIDGIDYLVNPLQ